MLLRRCVCACVVWLCVAVGEALVNKCCGELEHLTIGGQMTCQPARRSNRSDGLWWFPKEQLKGKGPKPGTVRYAIMPKCDMSAMDVILGSGFSLREGKGDLLLSIHKSEAHHDPDNHTREDNFPPSSFCVDWGSSQGQHVAVLCPCQHATCVRTCCMDGYRYNASLATCEMVPDEDEEFMDWVPKIEAFLDYYRLTGRTPSCESHTTHEVVKTGNGSFLLLLPDGSLKSLEGTDEVFPKDKYCVAFNERNREQVIFCMTTDVSWLGKRIAYGVMFIVGALCLLLTVLVTLILPELRRNIHGKMGVAHNTMLFIGYLVTGISQLNGSKASQATCETTSLLIQFSILAAFFWLNVMCIDISWTFSGLRPIQGSAMQRDRKKFIYYSLYVWGSSTLITIATVCVEYSSHLTSLKPSFGTKMCFFNNRTAELLFFYGPMALLLTANLFLFAYTAYKIISVKRETSILCTGDSSTNSKNKQTLILYVKLFCLMGITWVTEVLSWAIGGPNYYWYFTDTINLLRAVFIFVIFCCKRSVLVMLRERVSHWMNGEPMVNSHSRATRNHSNSSCTRTTGASITPSSRRKHSVNPAGEESPGVTELKRINTGSSSSSQADSTL